MQNKIQIGVLEDHIATASGYKTILEVNPKISVGWTASFYLDVEPNLDKYPTDLLILDMEVSTSPDNPEIYPVFQTIPALLEKYPEVKILVISMHNRPVLIKSVKNAGVSGYILKDDGGAFERLDEIILEITEQDSIYFSPQAAEVLEQPEEIPSLTTRQREILTIIASKPSIKTRELADMLVVSPSTIRNHLSDIYLKLDVKSKLSAILRAQQLGLISITGEISLD